MEEVGEEGDIWHHGRELYKPRFDRMNNGADRHVLPNVDGAVDVLIPEGRLVIPVDHV